MAALECWPPATRRGGAPVRYQKEAQLSTVTPAPRRPAEAEEAPDPAEPRSIAQALLRAVDPWRLRLRRAGPDRQREVILVLALLLLVGLFRPAPMWNEPSRYDLTVAIVRDHTTRIDHYERNTGDKAFYAGHVYTDKNPGSSLLAIPVYLALELTAALHGDSQPDEGQAIAAFAFVLAGVPTVILALLLLRYLRTVVPEWWAITMTLAFATGTIALPFATMFFGHALQSALLFGTFYVLWRAPARGSPWWGLLAGFLAGWAVVVDVSSAAAVLALMGYGLVRGRRLPFLMVAGALPCAVVLGAYDWISFDTPLSLGYQHLGPGNFADGQSRGLLGVTRPTLSSLREIMLGQRGLVRLSPFVCLAPLGLGALTRPALRREAALAALVCAAYVLLNSGYYLPLGGGTPGPRFLVPALPFLTILVALVPAAVRWVSLPLIAYASFLMVAAVATMPNVPEGVFAPIGDLWLPRLRAGLLADSTAFTRWGLHGHEPLVLLAAAVAVAAAALVATTRASNRARRLVAAGVGVLAVLVLALGTPVDARLPVPAAGNRTGITVLDLGVVRQPPTSDESLRMVAWVEYENLDHSLSRTRAVFSVADRDGRAVSTVYYGNVDWRPGQRSRLSVDWDPKGAPGGDYAFTASIQSSDASTTYVSVTTPFRLDY